MQEKHEAVGMLHSMTAAAFTRHFGVSRSTISRLQGRLVTTGSVADGRRSGRPRLTTATQDRGVRTTRLRNRLKSGSSTAREWDGNDISRHTVGRRLREEGIKCCRPCKKKFISDINGVERLRYATGKVRWTLDTARLESSDLL